MISGGVYSIIYSTTMYAVKARDESKRAATHTGIHTHTRARARTHTHTALMAALEP